MGLKILVVDDSATARAVLSDILLSDPQIESVDTAPDAYVARDKIVAKRPDVVCLDVEMPRMDGIAFLTKLMEHMPLPVVMVSSLTQRGAQTTLDALAAGAIDFVAKPHSNIYDGSDEIREELLEKVKNAAKAKIVQRKSTEVQRPLNYRGALSETTQKIVAIGASTGGTEALKDVLVRLPRNSPGIVIVQHMPADFTQQFAQRLNSMCEVEVKEAHDGDTVTIGQVLIAPGDLHMVLRRSGHRYYVQIGSGDKVSGHRPSVDVLFNSVSRAAGSNAVGVILTGMGADGAKGLLNMRNQGAHTIGQDEASCVVYGMPKSAYELGAVERQLPLQNIPQAILDLISEDARA